jgi:hypothetical protein
MGQQRVKSLGLENTAQRFTEGIVVVGYQQRIGGLSPTGCRLDIHLRASEFEADSLDEFVTGG